MMKRGRFTFYITFAFMLAFSMSAKKKKVDPVPYPEIAQSIKTGKSTFILLRGEDWDVPGTEISKKIWNSPAFRKNMTKVNLVEIPIPDDFKFSQYKLPFRVKKLPMIALIDSRGRTVFVQEDRLDNVTAGNFMNLLQNALKIQQTRDDFWKSSGTSVQKAAAIGKGFDCISNIINDDFYKEHYKKELELLESLDPEDKSGYVLKYANFNKKVYVSFSSVKKSKDKKKYLEHLNFLQKLTENKQITPEQLQKIHLAKYTSLTKGYEDGIFSKEEYKTAAYAELSKIYKIGPNSLRGKMIDYLKKETDKALSKNYKRKK